MSDNYLTMARIMGKEWREYQTKEVWGKGYTGHTEIAIKHAFETAFMAGFEGRIFGEKV
jgi:hypothetical protein